VRRDRANLLWKDELPRGDPPLGFWTRTVVPSRILPSDFEFLPVPEAVPSRPGRTGHESRISGMSTKESAENPI
jgi:hypothetical protein